MAPHADVWPAAIPAINFDSEDDADAHGPADGGGDAAPAPKGRKKKRVADGDGGVEWTESSGVYSQTDPTPGETPTHTIRARVRLT